MRWLQDVAFPSAGARQRVTAATTQGRKEGGRERMWSQATSQSAGHRTLGRKRTSVELKKGALNLKLKKRFSCKKKH